jgi:hypothetical protein
MRLVANNAEFERYLAAATIFWRNNTLPVIDGSSDDRWILVEALHQDIRVTLRNLAIANALRRVFPARLLVYTGTDEDWYTALWSGFDVGLMDRLARAHGADTVIDIHRAVDGRLAGGQPPPLVVGDRTIRETGTSIEPADMDETVEATTCRVLRVPRLTETDRAGEVYARVRDRSQQFAEIYEALFSGLNMAALITSHVDYNHWGLAVQTAKRFATPVVHVQSTGSLKAYAMFPENGRHKPTFRAELTEQIGDYFEKHVVPHRARIRRSAELVAWRSKGNLGRPSWWRGGSTASLEMRTQTERREVRAHVLARYGFDPDKPVITVFNHAVSDALGTNIELFDDLADWFERTVAYAADRNDANWLMVDHPSQGLYDVTSFFDRVAGQYADRTHMAFRPSRVISKNALWSLIDLGVTVRGSISNELPAYGIPTLQAGWSEWSSCGISRVAVDREDYFAALDESIKAITVGKPLVTDEQVERARLWTWLYRSGGDLFSPLIGPWDAGQSDHLLQELRIAMSHVESDGDPLFSSVRRMWTRREPLLTRFDMSAGDDALGDEMWG